jgi:hypothetical protein
MDRGEGGPTNSSNTRMFVELALYIATYGDK